MTRAVAVSLAAILAAPAPAVGTTRLEVNATAYRRFDYRLTPEVFDFRYAPYRWQGSICLPDDPHKSILGKDGALYYDFGRGRMFLFDTRVRGAIAGVSQLEWQGQELYHPRIPIVTTRHEGGGLTLTSVAWAAAPEAPDVTGWKDSRHDYLHLTLSNPGRQPRDAQLVVEIAPKAPLMLDSSGTRLVERDHPDRVFCQFWPKPERLAEPEPTRLTLTTSPRTERYWASPPAGTSDVFRHILAGWNQPLVFHFKPDPGGKYRVAFGIIEGWHRQPGVRPLDLVVEGKLVRTVDPIAEAGRNVPMIVWADAEDSDGDGKIVLEVRAHKKDYDTNTILSALWVFPADRQPADRALLAGRTVQSLAQFDLRTWENGSNLKVFFPATTLKAGKETGALVAVHRGPAAAPRARSLKDADKEKQRAIAWWKKADLPYDRITVADPAIQALADSCIRNIYQARELRNGRPAFQVGPTHYRGTWAADGPFILESITYLGRWRETRAGIEVQVDHDDGPGGVEFVKKCGLRLWMLLRHTELSGDLDWLRMMWPKVQENVRLIKEAREMTRTEPGSVNFGLTPPGYGDGGLPGKHREYTNVYWTLAGLKCAVTMADMLGRSDEKADWQAEFDDYWQTFDKARNRDKLKDQYGNTYVPVVMQGEQPQLPQCGAWAFMQSLYPGRLFDMNDELMLGTVKMLSATEEEGLIFGTGWIPDGVWNYAASFYGHVHLWLGHGDKLASVLYAFANHASPQLNWREEQNLVGQPERYVGDMPHNWASGEFLRMLRHAMILERGDSLHLLEGMPTVWTRPGGRTRLVDIPTSFGEMSLELSMDKAGRVATLKVHPPNRAPMHSLVVHTERFGRPVEQITLNGKPLRPGAPVPTDKPFTLRITLKR
ncbi:hypothetical protein HS125_10095 [bacterium]|nr:hypothetical protein [bacterium]